MATTAATLTDAELAEFGITPDDEFPHPHSPDHEWWNESYFWDWFDTQGTRAGHLRAGWHPNQDRFWIWVLLYNGAEWLVLEETRLPLADLALPELRYDRWGLTFSWTPESPLRRGRLEASGFGRIVSGPRAGLMLPFSIDLDIVGEGPPHSTGQGNVEGHQAEQYSASRFEQPVTVEGTTSIGPDVLAVIGQGERDHSWGPRDWNMEWLFCVMGGGERRFQWAAVDIEGLDRIGVGYHRAGGTTSNVVGVEEELVFDDDPTRTVSGRFSLAVEDGSTVAGTLETISGVEIDIAHCMVPPRPVTYRRALVRVSLDDGTTGIGWLEFNRFDPSRSPTP